MSVQPEVSLEVVGLAAYVVFAVALLRRPARSEVARWRDARERRWRRRAGGGREVPRPAAREVVLDRGEVHANGGRSSSYAPDAGDAGTC